ncbi:type IV secretion system DNA-binding domain-containing protein [Candidatus Peregrinibacteria bacterium]|nr:type IV secretion system DNA-binding domain-containing protein [Candidatus Peregrinibacteria bacterium]
MPSKDVGTPNVFWVNSRRLEPPHDLPAVGSVPDDELTLIGETNFRGHRQRFGIKTIDRRRHIYIIGKTGMGKSVLLENMIRSDVEQKKGVAVIDPHGDLAEAVIDFVPSRRTNDVVILDPSDISHPFAFNMLESGDDPHKRNLIASGLLGVFKKMYSESWGPRLEHILRNCLLALAETPNTSMMGIMRILVDDKYRKQIVEKLTNPMVRSFWVDEFGKMQDRMRTEAISPIQNKVGQFLSSPMIRNIVGQVKSTVNIRFMMDSGKIIIINLSKGKIGEDNSSLLGSMLITKFQLDAMSRADTAEKNRKDFYLYVDEFQNFATDAFATILSEARKYKLNLTMANQYIAQMPDEVRDAVFGNVGTSLCFQVGFDDAEYFSNQFSEEVLPNDIVSLPKYNCYTKLMIDGMPSKTFSLSTLPPPEANPEEGRREKIVRLSRERYCTPREVVEDKINRWSQSSYADKKKLEEEGKKQLNRPKGENSKSESRNTKQNPKSESRNTKQNPKSELPKPKSDKPKKQ